MLNKIMLITYPDSMGHDLKDLHHILNLYFKDAVKMVHILPFFPSSGDQHHKLKEKMERNLFAGSFHCVKI